MVSLRDPFPAEAVGTLPRGGVQLNYVGHAYVTERLLDVDPEWTWEPLAIDMNLLPKLDCDADGNPIGLWIKLTIGGVTRLGYGSVAPGTRDAVKQLIGDALRNAAMRFGVALDMWKKDEARSPSAPAELPAKPRTLGALREALASSSVTLRQVLDGYGIEALEQLTETQAQASLKALIERAKEAGESEGETSSDGNLAPAAAPTTSPPPKTPSATLIQLKSIRQLCDQQNISEETICEQWHVTRLENLTVDEASDAIRWLQGASPDVPAGSPGSSPRREPDPTTATPPGIPPQKAGAR